MKFKGLSPFEAKYLDEDHTMANFNYSDGSHPVYRIGTTDRTIGDPTGAADNFTVLNTTNNKVFIASGGFWTDGGTDTFDPTILADWSQS
jgi:hypothetical protein